VSNQLMMHYCHLFNIFNLQKFQFVLLFYFCKLIFAVHQKKVITGVIIETCCLELLNKKMVNYTRIITWQLYIKPFLNKSINVCIYIIFIKILNQFSESTKKKVIINWWIVTPRLKCDKLVHDIKQVSLLFIEYCI